MNKNPRRAVFFDVIGKASPAPMPTRLRIPGWWKRSAPPIPPPPDTEDVATSDTIDASAPIVWRSDGQLIISLGHIGKIVATAGLCAILLIAFGLGRKSATTSNAGHPPTIAAVNPPLAESHPPQTQSGSAGHAAPSPHKKSQANALDQLVSPPPVVVKKTAPQPPQDKPETVKPDKLKYLWIESIVAHRPSEWQLAEADARKIQEFLKREQVATTVEKKSNGFVVFSAEGYPEGEPAAADRNAFQIRVEKLGALYFKQGGGYSFKGCRFVTRSPH